MPAPVDQRRGPVTARWAGGDPAVTVSETEQWSSTWFTVRRHTETFRGGVFRLGGEPEVRHRK
ncbi:hypothetical protein GCM10023223_33610 [Stackebrandtia albiflava]